MKISLVFPTLPPALNGIGDYTARLAEALADRCQTRILTAQAPYDPIAGVHVESAFSTAPLRGVNGLLSAVARDNPNWVVLQYNPFSYGRRGFNPYLPFVLQQIKQRCPQTRLALMVHEPFVPVEDWRRLVMSVWQRWQLWMLGRTADLVFFSIDPWAQRFQQWFPATPVRHLPVGSNIPHVVVSRQEARRQVGLEQDAFVVGIFGSAHPSRLLHFVRSAVKALAAHEDALHVLYIGPSEARVHEALGGAAPFLATGALPPEAVSRHFAAMDLYLAPFRKGVSTRRGSFMVGIQHGVATISTHGSQTDALLRAQADASFLLAPDNRPEAFRQHALSLALDTERRGRIAQAGQAFFESTFSWARIAGTLLEALGDRTACIPCNASRASA